eukprot:2996336-Ditylum_brightwellii.AAC.1
MATEMGAISGQSLFKEPRNQAKATAFHLSTGVRMMVANDPEERSCENMNVQLQYYGCIRLTSAGGVIQVQTNGDLSHGIQAKNKRVQKEDFFSFIVKGDANVTH